MRLNLLKTLNENFGFKVFTAFTLFIFVISFSFTSFFIRHQSNSLRDTLIKNGKLLVNILAQNSRIGVFSESEDLLKDLVEGMFQQEGVLEVSVFNPEGQLLKSKERPKIRTSEKSVDGDRRMTRHRIFEKLKGSSSPYYLEGDRKVEFWAPVISSSGYSMEEPLFFKDDLPQKRYRIIYRIIGFVGITVDKEMLNRQLNHLLFKGILIGIIFLVIGSAVTYLAVKGITKPLDRLTEGAKTLGMGGTAEKVPVETEDQIGKLARAFNSMCESLESREKTLRENQERYRSVFENTGTATMIIEEDTTISMINTEWEELSGYSKKEVEGKMKWTDFVHKEDLERVKEYHRTRRPKAGEPLNEYEFRFFDRHGNVKDILGKTTVIPRAKRRVASWLDITARKQAEQALRESEERFRVVFNRVFDALVMIDEKGRIRDINEAACRILGYRKEELLNLSAKDIHPHEEMKKIQLGISRVLKNGIDYIGETAFVAKDGRTVPVEAGGVTLKVADKIYIVGSFRDITERKRAEEAVQRTKKELETIVDSVPALIAYKDTNNRYIRINKTYAEAANLPRDHIEGKSAFDIVSNREFAEAYWRADKEVIASGSPKRNIIEPLLFDETRAGQTDKIPYRDDKGNIIGVIVFCLDITSRVRAEQALRESEERYRTLVESSSDAIVMLDRDRKVVSCNQAFVDLFGYEKDEVEGRSIRIIHQSDDSFRSFGKTAYQAIDKADTYRAEWGFMRKDGTGFPVETVTSAIKSPDASTGGYVAIIRDITERKRAEEALRESQQHLFQAQKMEALGTLVSGVAHEINNPINSIMFNVDLLQKIWHDFQPILEEHAGREPHRKYGGLDYDFLKNDLGQLLSDMDMASNRITKIVTNLKNFARQSDIADMKPMQINEAIENATRLAQTTLMKSGIDIKLDLGHDLPPMEGNIQSVEQVALNLIINAIEAIDHDEGKIKVITGFRKKKGQVFVSISDNGRGIDPSVSDRLFDPFVTTRQTEGGTGLGLSVTYNLVKAHGGEITFESQREKGTTFKASFPLKR
jgi:PAS domain S-box-containing protein